MVEMSLFSAEKMSTMNKIRVALYIVDEIITLEMTYASYIPIPNIIKFISTGHNLHIYGEPSVVHVVLKKGFTEGRWGVRL